MQPTTTEEPQEHVLTASGEFDVHDAAILATEEKLHVVFGIARVGDQLQVTPLVFERRSEQLQRKINEMRAGVIERAAAVLLERLPVVSASEAHVADSNFEHPPDRFAAAHDLHDVP